MLSLTVWEPCGWGVIVPQQHRLVKIEPRMAPLLLALNNTAPYGGLAISSALGAMSLLFIDRHSLSLVGAGMVGLALILAEVTYLRILRGGACGHGTAAREPMLSFGGQR